MQNWRTVISEKYAGLKNDPEKKGELAGPKMIFGKNNRYSIAPVHCRLEGLAWFVWDANKPGYDYDPVLGWLPDVVKIADSWEEAVTGLPDLI